MGFEDYWYIVAESRELRPGRALGRCVLDEWLACFRDARGHAVVLRDRCLHRSGRLSTGTVRAGRLVCPYHGWEYDAEGNVVAVPSAPAMAKLCNPAYPVLERDGYVYVRLNRDAPPGIMPFRMPHYEQAGWKHVRLQNRFDNTVANCVENFIDIPHTAFVHRGIFRHSRGERIRASITRENASMHVRYRNERANLGSFGWLLNPRGAPIGHTDSFHAPNVTCVRYELPRGWVYVITSQSVPMSERQTLVYTDLTYRFAPLTAAAAWFVRRQAQRVIDQDIDILERQMQVIGKYGPAFVDTPADAIHRCVDSLREAIAQGRDPCALPPLSTEIEFLV